MWSWHSIGLRSQLCEGDLKTPRCWIFMTNYPLPLPVPGDSSDRSKDSASTKCRNPVQSRAKKKIITAVHAKNITQVLYSSFVDRTITSFRTSLTLITEQPYHSLDVYMRWDAISLILSTSGTLLRIQHFGWSEATICVGKSLDLASLSNFT